MTKANPKFWTNRSGRLLRQVAGLMVLLGLLAAPRWSAGGESPSLTEYQVKALFLLNFTKYVEWPAAAFSRTDSPITISVLGDEKVGDALKIVAAGKTVCGRAIIVQQIADANDEGKCHILFISASETSRLTDLLDRIKRLPVLTVGETEHFTQQGGMVNFIKKDGKIRLEIDLAASRAAKLQISSQLLRVADTVRGNQ